MNMEFIHCNYINTTTMFSVTSGTTSAQYFFDRQNTRYYESSGQGTDGDNVVIRIDLGTTQTVDRIVLENINWKGFRIYYDSNTANVFSLTSADTGSSQWTGNSATNIYMIFATTITTDLITIAATSTMDANEEKKCAGLWVSRQYHGFSENPRASDYRPSIGRKSYNHEMSDGGIAQYVISKNFTAEIKRTYVTEAERSELREMFDDWDPFVFIPGPTGTAWDARIYEVNWLDVFDFDQYTTNYKDNGYSGTIRIAETPK